MTATKLFSAPIDLGDQPVHYPQIIKNFDNWYAHYPVTLKTGGNVDVVLNDSDGSLFVFVTLHALFGLGGAVNTKDEVNFLDVASLSILPLTKLPALDQSFIPETTIGEANYSYTSGITIGGSIGLEVGGGGKGEGGGGGGGGAAPAAARPVTKVTIGANFSYTNSRTTSVTLKDVASRTNLNNQVATWIFTTQQVSEFDEPDHVRAYDPDHVHDSIKASGPNLRKPPPAPTSSLDMPVQAIWQLKPDTGGKLVFAVVQQARMVHGEMDIGTANCSWTWVSPPAMFFQIDLDAKTVSPLSDGPDKTIHVNLLPLLLGGDLHVDGSKDKDQRA